MPSFTAIRTMSEVAPGARSVVVVVVVGVMGSSAQTFKRGCFQGEWRCHDPVSYTHLWGFGVVGAIVLAGDALWYLSWRGSHDEALRTQTLLVAVWGLLVGIGALSGRHWGRRAILTVGILSMVFGAAGAALEAPVAGAALFVAGLLVIIGWSKLRHLPVLAPPGASTP